MENIDLDPLEYGYRLTDEKNLVPIILTKPSIPRTFFSHATAKNAAKPVSANVDYRIFCKCRLLDIRCCQFCECDASPRC